MLQFVDGPFTIITLFLQWHTTPVISKEQIASQHLFGREVLVVSLSKEFLGEICGISLQRTDTVIIKDIQLSQFVGGLLRNGARGGRQFTNAQQQGEHQCATSQ